MPRKQIVRIKRENEIQCVQVQTNIKIIYFIIDVLPLLYLKQSFQMV